MFQVKGQKTRS